MYSPIYTLYLYLLGSRYRRECTSGYIPQDIHCCFVFDNQFEFARFLHRQSQSVSKRLYVCASRISDVPCGALSVWDVAKVGMFLGLTKKKGRKFVGKKPELYEMLSGEYEMQDRLFNRHHFTPS